MLPENFMRLVFHFIKRMTWIGIVLICTACLSVSKTYAQTDTKDPFQRIEVPSSMNPVGSGARALGMGGAFIAVADDATAASWNPGGLIQLETPEISVVGAYFQRNEDLAFGTNPEADGEQDVAGSNINYLSAAYPFTAFNRNMIVSVNYQYLFDFTRQWEFPLRLDEPDFVINQEYKIDQEGGLSAIGVAYCIQWTPKISFGFTLNFWQNALYDNKWHSETKTSASGNLTGSNFSFNYKGKDEYTFSGFNANLGLLYNINSQFTLGLVLKTPFKADLIHNNTGNLELLYPENPSNNQSVSSSNETNEELDMPMSYGIGFAYRFSDNLTASFDIYRTEWANYILTDAEGNEKSPITGQQADKADIDPTHQIRAGAEYLFIKNRYVIPFRGGIFYDPAPADGKPDDIYGFSLGSGVAIGKFIFDMAYQYRFGNDVQEFILEGYNFSQDISEHTFYSSIIFHF